MNYKHEIKYERHSHYEVLSTVERELVFEAQNAMRQAYAPYSKFKVGAALLLTDGTIVKGNNQENIAYPSGLCAERVALFHAGANYSDSEVVSIVIVAEGDLLQHEDFVSPCGACRQVMLETECRQENPLRIILVGQKGQVVIFYSAQDLLPFAFR
jgi:cytidine deaminase